MHLVIEKVVPSSQELIDLHAVPTSRSQCRAQRAVRPRAPGEQVQDSRRAARVSTRGDYALTLPTLEVTISSESSGSGP